MVDIACYHPERSVQRSARLWVASPVAQVLSILVVLLGAWGNLPAAHAAYYCPEGALCHDRVNPHWTADGNAFWYQSRGPRGTRMYYWVDAVAGTRVPAFDHAKLAAAVSEITFERHEANKLSIDSIEIRDNGQVIVDMGGRRWAIRSQDGSVSEVPGPAAPSLVRRLSEVRPSTTNGVETWLDFTNATRKPITIVEIGGDGQAVDEFQIAPSHGTSGVTSAGTVFRIINDVGETIGVYQAVDDASAVVVDDRNVALSKPATAASTTSPSTTPAEPGLSPDGKMVAFVHEHNIYLRDQRTRTELRLTSDGKPDDAYQGVFHWSPDSTKLITVRTSQGEASQVLLIQHAPPDQLRPKLVSFGQWKPGDRIPEYKLTLIDVVSGTTIPVSDELFPHQAYSYDRVVWTPDSRNFSFVYGQRGQQIVRLVIVDAKTGHTRAAVDERSETFVDIMKWHAWPVYQTNELIWMSERDGWNHLYLSDLTTGKIKNRITRGDWVVLRWDTARDWVDEQKRQIGFRAAGLVPGQDPYYEHFCRVNFDGSGFVDLTPADGTHTITYSPDRRFYLDTYSRVDLPPVTELRRSSDGSLVCPLEKGELDPELANGWQTPERFVAKARDGMTDIYGVIYRPSNFDPNKRYPVIEDIYGGPGDSWVPKAFTKYEYGMEIADLGFIVVQIDGMGTNNRSKAFLEVCWRNLGDGGFPDRIAWIRAAAARYPSMDLSRVGVYGASYGGYLAMRALLAHGDFYKVAVSDSGVHDARLGPLHEFELWMGWPVGPWYAEQSNVTNAHKLEGKLMLIVRELDQNVDPACTFQVVNELIKADKDFDLVIVPNADHQTDVPYIDRRRKDFLVRHLIGDQRRSNGARER